MGVDPRTYPVPRYLHVDKTYPNHTIWTPFPARLEVRLMHATEWVVVSSRAGLGVLISLNAFGSQGVGMKRAGWSISSEGAGVRGCAEDASTIARRRHKDGALNAVKQRVKHVAIRSACKCSCNSIDKGRTRWRCMYQLNSMFGGPCANELLSPLSEYILKLSISRGHNHY